MYNKLYIYTTWWLLTYSWNQDDEYIHIHDQDDEYIHNLQKFSCAPSDPGVPHKHVASQGKASTWQCRGLRRLRVDPCVGEIPWRRKQQPPPILLPGKSCGQRSLGGYSPWGLIESAMTEWLGTHTCTPLLPCLHPWGTSGVFSLTLS